MTLTTKVRHIGGVGQLLLRSPEQVRYLPAWTRALYRTTMDSRLPWLPFSVVDELAAHLTSTSRVFEFGGGGSTLWFSRRAAEVVTVEHDPAWYPFVAKAVVGVPTCTVLHRGEEDRFAAYIAAIQDYPDEYFDVIVVDGRERVRCLAAAMPKVRRGGWLLLDDSERGRYAPAFELAAAWPCRTFRGLAPSKAVPGTTTVWTRP